MRNNSYLSKPVISKISEKLKTTKLRRFAFKTRLSRFGLIKLRDTPPNDIMLSTFVVLYHHLNLDAHAALDGMLEEIIKNDQ